jgi:hypothetical protein
MLVIGVGVLDGSYLFGQAFEANAFMSVVSVNSNGAPFAVLTEAWSELGQCVSSALIE